MAIQSYTPEPFELEVSDRTVGLTTLKQKATFLALVHNDKLRTCAIHILVSPYAVAGDGSYGPPLSGGPFAPYEDTIVADNNRLVDTRNGAILAERYAKKADGTASTDADWQAAINRVQTSEVQAMYQGDYFLYLRDSQPLVIGDVIRQYIQQADAAPSRYA